MGEWCLGLTVRFGGALPLKPDDEDGLRRENPSNACRGGDLAGRARHRGRNSLKKVDSNHPFNLRRLT